MVEGRLRSRSLRRDKVRTPKGTLKTHFNNKQPGKAQCGGCGYYLSGVARVHSAQLKNMPLSQKRPSRPYGGVLCSKCSRSTIADKVRAMFLQSK